MAERPACNKRKSRIGRGVLYLTEGIGLIGQTGLVLVATIDLFHDTSRDIKSSLLIHSPSLPSKALPAPSDEI